MKEHKGYIGRIQNTGTQVVKAPWLAVRPSPSTCIFTPGLASAYSAWSRVS